MAVYFESCDTVKITHVVFIIIGGLNVGNFIQTLPITTKVYSLPHISPHTVHTYVCLILRSTKKLKNSCPAKQIKQSILLINSINATNLFNTYALEVILQNFKNFLN